MADLFFSSSGLGIRRHGSRPFGNTRRRPGLHRTAAMDPFLQRPAKKVVRVSHRERTYFIETRSEVRGNIELEGRKIVFKLRELGGSKDGRGDAGLCCDPIHGHLSGRLIDLLRDFEQDIRDAPVAFGELIEDGVFFGFFEAPFAAP